MNSAQASIKDFTVTVTVRPLRLSFYLEKTDPEKIAKIVRHCCTLWGGIYNPIIIQGKRSKTELDGLLALFDPDLCVAMDSRVLYKANVPEHRMVQFGQIGKSDQTIGCDISSVLKHLFETRFRFEQRYPPRVLTLDERASNHLCDIVYFGAFPREKGLTYAKNYRTVFQPHKITGLTDWKYKESPANYLSPVTLTRYQIRARSKFHFYPVVFIFDGENAEDCVDFWNLRAAGLSVFGLPVECLESWASKLPDFLLPYAVPWTRGDNRKLLIQKSRNVPQPKFLDEVKLIESLLRGIEVIRNTSFPRLHKPEYWSSDQCGTTMISSRSRDLEITSRDSTLRWQSLAPEFAEGRSFGFGLLWANDVEIKDYNFDGYRRSAVFPNIPPKTPVSLIDGAGALGLWRTNKGLVHYCSHVDDLVHHQLESGSDTVSDWLGRYGIVAEKSDKAELVDRLLLNLGGTWGAKILKLDGFRKVLDLIHKNGSLKKSEIDKQLR